MLRLRYILSFIPFSRAVETRLQPSPLPHLHVPSLVPSLLLKDRSEYITEGCLMKYKSNLALLYVHYAPTTWFRHELSIWKCYF